MQFVRDFSDRQSQLFVMIATFLVRAAADSGDLHSLLDDDVADAMRSLAATFETSVRGVIYEHRPQSLPAQRIVTNLKPLLVEAGKSGGTAFERDAAVVMRRLERAVDEVRTADPADRRALLAMLERIFAKSAAGDPEPAAEEPRLIIP